MLRALAPFFAIAVVLAIAPTSARGQDAAGAAPPRFEVVRTHTVPGGVTFAAAFAPNGTALCTGGELGDVILWDLKTGAPRWRAQQSDHCIGEIAWPPAGDRIAVLGRELTVHDATDGRELLRCSAYGPHGLAFSPDGRRLAFQRSSGAVSVIGVAGGDAAVAFDPLAYPLNGLAFAADGETLFAGDSAGRVFSLTLRDREAAELYTHGLGSGNDACQAVALCGGHLLSFGAHGDIRFGDRAFRLDGALYVAAAAPGGEGFAAGGNTGKVTVWSERGARERTLDVGAQIAALAFHPDGSTLAIATYDGALQLWRDGAAQRALPGHAGRTCAVAWSADGTVLAIGGERRTVFVQADGTAVELPAGAAVCRGRTGDELFTREPGWLTARSGRTGESQREWLAANDKPDLFGPSPDGGSFIVSGPLLRDATRLRLGTGDSTAIEGHGRALDAAWSAAGWLALGRVRGEHGESGCVQLFDPAGKLKFTEPQDCGVATVAFSPDGSQLVYAYGGGSMYRSVPDNLRVRSVATGELLREVAATVRWFRFLDARTAVAHDGASLSVWDLERWQPTSGLPLGVIFGAELAPDHKAVAVRTAGDVRVVRIRDEVR